MTKHDSKDEEILAGAPNNTWMAYSQDNDIYVTPLDNGNYLFKTSGATKSWVGNKLGFTRSQSDIVELVELRKKNAELENQNSINEHLTHENLELSGRIAELERENLKALGWIAKAMMQGLNEVDCSDELLKIIAKRDLEQQAKGSDDFYDYLESIENMYIPSDYISDFKKILSEQAKQLEDGTR